VKFHSNTLGPVPLQLASMIDIMLVLLMFFILSYKFASDETDLDIKVPTSKEGVDSSRVGGEILVNVRADGTVVVEGKQLTLEELQEKLAGVVKVFKDQPIRLRGDGNVIYQKMVLIIDACRKAGVWNISFATQRPEQAAAPQP
jgi:biopolymer transport protein ExbD